jgi:hypothetical protein
MKTGFVLSGLAGIACMLAACATQPKPTASAVTTTQRFQCSSDPAVDQQQLEQVMQQTTVIKSQPLYSLVNSKDVPLSARVLGATLVVQPPNGTTTAELTRLLRCHGARTVLAKGSTSTFGTDPFYLADSWLDIDVKEAQGAYAITIGARNVRKGLEVFRNANMFAVDHGGRVDNRCVAWASTSRSGGDGCVARATAVGPMMQ